MIESHGSKLLQLDTNDQIIHRESPPSISENINTILIKVIKIKRIKYRTDDHIEEYWKYWKGDSDNINDYERILRDDERRTSLRIQELWRIE
jgi:hypothetical protein